MDQGVIYCKTLMQSFLAAVETESKLSQIVKSVSVLHAIRWVAKLIQKMEEETRSLFHNQQNNDIEVHLRNFPGHHLLYCHRRY